jgi:hypothetical protein
MAKVTAIKYSGVFYLKVMLMSFLLWLWLELATEWRVDLHDFLVPFVTFLYLCICASYRLEIANRSIVASRSGGVLARIALDKLTEVSKRRGWLRLVLSDDTRYRLPLSRFSKADQALLQQKLDAALQGVLPAAELAPLEWLSRRAAKREIKAMADKGVSRQEIFNRLSERGIPLDHLARLIAVTPDPTLCLLHNGKNNLLLTLIFAQGLLMFGFLFLLALFGRYDEITLIGSTGIVIEVLLLWGVYRYSFWAYNLYLVLSMVNLPAALKGVFEDPGLLRMVSIAFAVLCIALAWNLRAALYPDLGWFRAARKVDGEYRFGP